jgi:nitroreductase
MSCENRKGTRAGPAEMRTTLITSTNPDQEIVLAALRLAVRAPSVHNTQPWGWRVNGRTVHLYADPSRQVPATDPLGRDLMISCGAALHHLLIALAASGWASRVRRLPDPHRPDHLATVELTPHVTTNAEAELATAIPHRRTDRRGFTSWPVPGELIGGMIELAENEGLTLQQVTDPRLRWRLYKAIVAAAEIQEADPAYPAEIARWSGCPDAATDGVPAANTPTPDPVPGRMPMRAFAGPALTEPPRSREPENAALLLLSTFADTPANWLRAGEVTSAVLLTATRAGLGSSPLTQPLEVENTRAFVRDHVAASTSAHPQILLRIGWAPPGAGELPATPRRPLDDVVSIAR